MTRVSLFWMRVLGPTIARYGWFLIVIPLVLANVGAFRAASAPKEYKASSVLTIGNTLVDLAIGQADSSGGVVLNRELGVALSSDTMRLVEMAPGTILSGRVVQDTNQIVLEAKAKSAVAARDAANSFATNYIAESLRRRSEAYDKAASFFATNLQNAERELARSDVLSRPFYQNRVNDLRARMLDAQAQANKPSSTSIEQETPAGLPGAPINRSVSVSALLGFIFGIGICGALILVLDFGEKQRVSVDDIHQLRPDLQILGVSRTRNLRTAGLVGHGVQTAASAADTAVLCAAFVGTRARTGPLTDAVVGALRSAGTNAVQVRMVTAASPDELSVQIVSDSLWMVNIGDPSLGLDARDLLKKCAIESQVGLAVVQGPSMRDRRASPASFDLADQVLLVVDSASASEEQVNEALLILEAFNKPILGVVFVPK